MLNKVLFSLLTVMVLFSGCATKDSLIPGTGGSTFEIRGKNYDEVWKAIVKTAGKNLTLTEANKEKGILKAETAIGVATYGEVVGIYVKPVEPASKVYTVEVQSLKRYSLQLVAQDWTMTMIAGIKAELDQ